MSWVEDKTAHIATAVALEGERTRLALAAGLAETQRGLRIDGALARPLLPNAVNYAAGGRLVGFSLRAVAGGGDCIVNLYDGTAPDANRYLATVDLNDGTSTTVPLPVSGVSFVDGLYVEVTGGGTPVGAEWIGAVD